MDNQQDNRDAILRLTASDGWKLVEDYIQKQMDMGQFLAVTPENLGKLQSKMQAYKDLLAWVSEQL